MSSREAILKSIRQHLPESSPLPDLDGPWITFDDPAAQFASVLEMIGGRCLRVAAASEIPAALSQLPAYATADKRLNAVADVNIDGVDVAAIAGPHDLADIDFAILPGEFGVAENAAVWIDGSVVPQRVIFFLCQHLALVVPASEILNNLGEAYQRIRCPQAGFGAFIAGPSKTADIEQSLVIGAHGARSLTVILVG
jgi:L-lactate dehydrogenase complex protein LldG